MRLQRNQAVLFESWETSRDFREAKRVLEIKCPGKVDHATALAGKIPEHYLYQCVHLMLVADLPALDYYSFDGWNGVVVSMKRDAKLENELFKAEKKFWEYVVSDSPPPFEIPKRKIGVK